MISYRIDLTLHHPSSTFYWPNSNLHCSTVSVLDLGIINVCVLGCITRATVWRYVHRLALHHLKWLFSCRQRLMRAGQSVQLGDRAAHGHKCTCARICARRDAQCQSIKAGWRDGADRQSRWVRVERLRSRWGGGWGQRPRQERVFLTQHNTWLHTDWILMGFNVEKVAHRKTTLMFYHSISRLNWARGKKVMRLGQKHKRDGWRRQKKKQQPKKTIAVQGPKRKVMTENNSPSKQSALMPIKIQN